jgi:hypothetical protein
MKTKVEVIEHFIKTGTCGSASCHYDCPFFSKKKEVCKFHNTTLYKSIYKLRKENELLIAQIGKPKEEEQYETCPYRSTDMGCDYCDYRDRDLKDEWEENDR